MKFNVILEIPQEPRSKCIEILGMENEINITNINSNLFIHLISL